MTTAEIVRAAAGVSAQEIQEDAVMGKCRLDLTRGGVRARLALVKRRRPGAVRCPSHRPWPSVPFVRLPSLRLTASRSRLAPGPNGR